MPGTTPGTIPGSLRALLLTAPLIVGAAPAAAQTAPPPPESPPAVQGTSNARADQAPAPPSPPPQVGLPSWLGLRGELRERMEGVRGARFVSSADDLYWLSRVRVDLSAMADRPVSFHLQAQDARVGRKSIEPTGVPFASTLDLRMAYVDVGRDSARVAARLGRQELVYGDQRLVGHVSWLNTARTFDGARVIVRTPGIRFDVFGTSVVRLLPGELDKSGNGNRFAGLYVWLDHLVPGTSIEPFLFWRRDRDRPTEAGGAAILSHRTIGVRSTGALPTGFTYGLETAWQRGSVGQARIDAWAGHYQIGTPTGGPWALGLTAEYNYASGDTDPNDGVQQTFDQLYPTPHDKYGLADQVGWRNIRHVRIGTRFTPVRQLPLTVNYHTWWLAEAADGLYSASGASSGASIVPAGLPEGAVARHVGQELDVQVSRQLLPQVRVAAGYAHLFPGAFLKEATPGASYSSPYVMVTYVFLREE